MNIDQVNLTLQGIYHNAIPALTRLISNIVNVDGHIFEYRGDANEVYKATIGELVECINGTLQNLDIHVIEICHPCCRKSAEQGLSPVHAEMAGASINILRTSISNKCECRTRKVTLDIDIRTPLYFDTGNEDFQYFLRFLSRLYAALVCANDHRPRSGIRENLLYAIIIAHGTLEQSNLHVFAPLNQLLCNSPIFRQV